MDNVMIERLWKSVKYECVYLQELETGPAKGRDQKTVHLKNDAQWSNKVNPLLS